MSWSRAWCSNRFLSSTAVSGCDGSVRPIIWILLAPMWFWFEYFFLFQDETKSGVKLEEFKHGQDQSAKIWLALVTVLAGLYFGKDLVREEQTPPCTPGSSGAPASQLKPQSRPAGNVPASKPPDLGPHQ
jgi:hypothetical protein